MSLKSERINESIAPFPAGNNIRITIAGLAVCKFNTDTTMPSLIHFLKHVPHHKLRVIVKRRAVGSTDFETLPEKPLPIDSNPDTQNIITVTGSDMGEQLNYEHRPEAEEFPLDNILNISNLHRTRFTRNTNNVTEMRLSRCSFYTQELTNDFYFVVVPDNIGNLQFPRQLGKVLGAYMKVTGTISIKVDGNPFFEKPIVDNGITYEYQIEFTNHCDPERSSECGDVIGSAGGDVKFLYDVITPPKNRFEKIILLKLGRPKENNLAPILSDVAACLPATIEPCELCS